MMHWGLLQPLPNVFRIARWAADVSRGYIQLYLFTPMTMTHTQAYCFFATHFHQLTRVLHVYPNIVNLQLHVDVASIAFLYYYHWCAQSNQKAFIDQWSRNTWLYTFIFVHSARWGGCQRSALWYVWSGRQDSKLHRLISCRRVENGRATGFPITNHYACFADYRKGTNWALVRNNHSLRSMILLAGSTFTCGTS